MKLSKKAVYALRALAILAGRPPSSSMQIQELAEAGQIPVKFLEQILLVLKRAQLLRSKRGVGGGYQLNKPSNEISLAEVIQIVDGQIGRSDEPEGSSAPGCRGLNQSLAELDRMILEYLQGQTIASLLIREEPDSVLALDI